MSRYCHTTAVTGHGMFTTCGEKFYGAIHQCVVCRALDNAELVAKTESFVPPMPTPERRDYIPRSRLKPRATLPGDMRTEWLHGWWCGIGVGAVIGAALMCMVVWSQR